MAVHTHRRAFITALGGVAAWPLAVRAREAFASIVDYLRDYNDVRDLYSMSQRLEVDRHIDSLLKTISDEGAAVAAGLRHARIPLKSGAPDRAPMDWTNIYFVLAPNELCR